MKRTIALGIAIVLLLAGCSNDKAARVKGMIGSMSSSEKTFVPDKLTSYINEQGETVRERITPMKGYERVAVEEGSFGAYLRELPLKPHGSPVRYYDGDVKTKEVHIAVIDMEIGNRDLQQCADAVMRLRAEYLYGMKQFEKIHFNFTNGFRADYDKWKAGYRVAINGNNTSWIKKTEASSTYESFRKYLDIVFAYAGTASLEKELESVQVEDMQIGDVFMKGGSPGHCVIVVDMTEDKATGEKQFLLAQSYMPAQEIHILKNPKNSDDNPWYSLKAGQELDTPEWDFVSGALMRFRE